MYTERTDKMKSSTTFREWSQAQRPTTQSQMQRPTFYTKKSKEDEYPPLSVLPQQVKLRTEQQGPSLASRIATAIKIDEQNIVARRVVEKPKPIQQYDLLPISQYGRLKFLAERKERAEREAAAVADDHEYRWQMSREISREKFDREYGVEPIGLPEDSAEYNNESEDTHTENEYKNPVQ